MRGEEKKEGEGRKESKRVRWEEKDRREKKRVGE